MEGGFLFDPLDNSWCLQAALTAEVEIATEEFTGIEF